MSAFVPVRRSSSRLRFVLVLPRSSHARRPDINTCTDRFPRLYHIVRLYTDIDPRRTNLLLAAPYRLTHNGRSDTVSRYLYRCKARCIQSRSPSVKLRTRRLVISTVMDRHVDDVCIGSDTHGPGRRYNSEPDDNMCANVMFRYESFIPQFGTFQIQQRIGRLFINIILNLQLPAVQEIISHTDTLLQRCFVKFKTRFIKTRG